MYWLHILLGQYFSYSLFELTLISGYSVRQKMLILSL